MERSSPAARLEVSNVTCLRHDRVLFENLSFTSDPGSIVQIDGANGSGKTSLLRIICGLLPPESGEIRWNGIPINTSDLDFSADLNYFGHKFGVKPELSVIENLELSRDLVPSDPDADLSSIIDNIGLGGYQEVICHALSAGQKRRVGLARLFFTRCPLWVLDEPFTALDKPGRDLLVNRLIQHSNDGGVTLMTTHQAVEIPGKPVQRIHLDP